MKTELITRLHKNFEDHAHQQDGVEYWNARELQVLLGYIEWRNFLFVVDKARIACRNAGQSDQDHFVDVNKMVGNAMAGDFAGGLGLGNRCVEVSPFIVAE